MNAFRRLRHRTMCGQKSQARRTRHGTWINAQAFVMSIVTGIATASGISPLLNAPRETSPDQRPTPLPQAEQANGAGRDPGRSVTNAATARPVIGVARGSATGETDDTRASSDSRYMRFVKALEIVRTDPTVTVLDNQRMAELAEEEEDFFLIGDGIPREVEPLLPERSFLIDPPVDLKQPVVLDLRAAAEGRADTPTRKDDGEGGEDTATAQALADDESPAAVREEARKTETRAEAEDAPPPEMPEPPPPAPPTQDDAEDKRSALALPPTDPAPSTPNDPPG